MTKVQRRTCSLRRVREAAGANVDVAYSGQSLMTATAVTITVTQELVDVVEGSMKGPALIVLRGTVDGGQVTFAEPEVELPPGAKDEEGSIRELGLQFLDVLVCVEVN